MVDWPPCAATVTSVTTAIDRDRPAHHRSTTPDGVGIEVYDFGGRGRSDLLLVHATGFCAEVFIPLAAGLSDQFHCWGVDLRAHGRSERPGDGDFEWSGFAADVATAVDDLGLDHPYAFGHSCGGAAVLLAEQAAPGTFRALYCFEPVMFPGTPDADVPSDNPLSAGARRRRDTFPSAELAFTNFSSKPPFSSLDPDVLLAYVESGFELIPVEGGATDVPSGFGAAATTRRRSTPEASLTPPSNTFPRSTAR